MTSAAFDADPPEGWEAWRENGEFMQANGPLWYRVGAAGHEYAFTVTDRHANRFGRVHGGMICAFCDHALGQTAWQAIGRKPLATVHLGVDFIATATLGELVQCRAEIVRQTRSLLFMRGSAVVGDRCVASASGVWKIIGA